MTHPVWYRSGTRIHMDRQQWYIICLEGEERVIAYVPFGDRVIKGVSEFHTCTSEANLISAAPELLAACKAALGAFENNDCIDWDDLDRAIAKAEGKVAP